MKRIVLALSLALCMVQSPAIEVSGNTLILDASDIKRCESGGGCGLVTRHDMNELLKKQHCIMFDA